MCDILKDIENHLSKAKKLHKFYQPKILYRRRTTMQLSLYKYILSDLFSRFFDHYTPVLTNQKLRVVIPLPQTFIKYFLIFISGLIGYLSCSSLLVFFMQSIRIHCLRNYHNTLYNHILHPTDLQLSFNLRVTGPTNFHCKDNSITRFRFCHQIAIFI